MKRHTLFIHPKKDGQRPSFSQQGVLVLHAAPAFPHPVGCGGGAGGWQKWHWLGSTVGPHREPGGGRAPDGHWLCTSQMEPLQQSGADALDAPHTFSHSVHGPEELATGGGGAAASNASVHTARKRNTLAICRRLTSFSSLGRASDCPVVHNCVRSSHGPRGVRVAGIGRDPCRRGRQRPRSPSTGAMRDGACLAHLRGRASSREVGPACGKIKAVNSGRGPRMVEMMHDPNPPESRSSHIPARVPLNP
jgi:hypothetical protein